MKKHWNDLVISAAPFIEFLERDRYFDSAYFGDRSGKLIIEDASLAFNYASDESFDNFDGWETVTDSDAVFPDSFEWSSWVSHNLRKNNYFSFESKDFCNADGKWAQGGVCLLRELMSRDIKIILNCYSNDFFPNIWRDILNVYLNNGFPCGWDGRYPDGKLVVFSNNPID
ncbi:hypothetical protein OU994_30720 [Pseudoduganella sp. SL102]|uniref:hypothetical protein n=1 Tax=Pseudoduganella sp. SL102 TaxID=2995154 RepID=UPI00248D15E6|nr:hypothetical protein [Pseudoduganella sp. SL102]WBS02562.1 hypothetical protein OU994_30720 [Pseudoduganella sp. SL102]